MTEPTYTRGNGETVVISGLDFHHAKSALAKLQRADPDRTQEIADLQAHVDKLAAQWAAEHPDGV